MQIKNLTTADYEEWDKFCAESNDAWFWHTSLWIRYTQIYAPHYIPDLKPQGKSFFVTEGERIVAVCPLFVEIVNGRREFSYGSMPLPVPALASHLNQTEREAVLKFIFGHLAELADELSVSRAMFQFSVLAPSFQKSNLAPFNYLLKFGFLDTSIHTQIVDLRADKNSLRKDFRHGHDAAVDAGAKIFKARVVDQAHLSEDIFQKYAAIHEQAGGGKVRSQGTYAFMARALRMGQAFMVAALQEDEVAGVLFFYVYKNNCYYASSGIAAKFAKQPVTHFLQWAAVQYMKSESYEYYELGWQFFAPSLFHPVIEKDLAISRFKRGFGGFTVILPRGEKYYDPELFQKTFSNNINIYAQMLRT